MSARRWLLTLLGVLLFVTLPALAPISASAEENGLTVSIDEVSPKVLTRSSTITIHGTVTNTGTTTWGAVQAYLAIPRWPFTTRTQVENAITNDQSYVGERIIDAGTFAELGDLAPGETASYRVRVPASSLHLSQVQGVHPIAIQVLATDEEGFRSTTSRARAMSFLPRVDTEAARVSAGTIWPFLPTWSIDDTEPQEIAEKVTTGQLRRYLSLAQRVPRTARTLVIEPSLLDELADIAADPEGSGISEELADQVTSWIDELLALARDSDTWILDYGRPDLLALREAPESASQLRESINAATQDALQRHGLSGPRIFWPAADDTTSALVDDLRSLSNSPVIVNASQVRSWEPRHGSVVIHDAARGRTPLVILPTHGDVAATDTVATFTQRLVTEAALAQMDARIDSDAQADALLFVDPRWDPGTDATATALVSALASDSALPLRHVTLTQVMQAGPATLPGAVSSSTTVEPLHPDVLHQAVRHRDAINLHAQVTVDTPEVSPALRDTARAVSLRWRGKDAAAQSWIQDHIRIERQWSSNLAIETPQTITLSGTTGIIPLTVSNETDHAVDVGLRLSADNAGLFFDPIDFVTIAPGERHTVTIDVDMGQQVSSTVTARLVTRDGTVFGDPSVFLVRTSNVGLIVWIGMGLAVALVAATWARRFLRKRLNGQEVTDG